MTIRRRPARFYRNQTTRRDRAITQSFHLITDQIRAAFTRRDTVLADHAKVLTALAQHAQGPRPNAQPADRLWVPEL